MYKIEKNVPYRASKKAKNHYPFAEMEVGDSFIIPTEKQAVVLSQSKSWLLRYKPDAKFSSRTIDGVTRVWRIK